MTTTERDERLAEVGQNAMASIREMVAALECDYDRLAELREDREAWGAEDHDGEAWETACRLEAEELADLKCAAGDCESEDDARDRITEDPLSLEFRSGWVSSRDEMEPAEYCLLLTTGGPAVRIVGEIENGMASSARLEVQDWGTPWTEHITTGSDRDALMAYVECFCFEF